MRPTRMHKADQFVPLPYGVPSEVAAAMNSKTRMFDICASDRRRALRGAGIPVFCSGIPPPFTPFRLQPTPTASNETVLWERLEICCTKSWPSAFAHALFLHPTLMLDRPESNIHRLQPQEPSVRAPMIYASGAGVPRRGQGVAAPMINPNKTTNGAPARVRRGRHHAAIEGIGEGAQRRSRSTVLSSLDAGSSRAGRSQIQCKRYSAILNMATSRPHTVTLSRILDRVRNVASGVGDQSACN